MAGAWQSSLYLVFSSWKTLSGFECWAQADMEALVTRTLSSCRHECSGNTDVIIVRTCINALVHGRYHRAVAIRTHATKPRSVVNTDVFAWKLSSCGHGCSRHAHAVDTNVIIVRTWMLWEHGRYHRADMDALVTRTLSSCGHECSGNTDVIILRTWMLW